MQRFRHNPLWSLDRGVPGLSQWYSHFTWLTSTEDDSPHDPLSVHLASWQSALDDPAITSSLVQDEIDNNWVEKFSGDVAAAQSFFNGDISVGRLGVGTSDSRPPRLVVDLSLRYSDLQPTIWKSISQNFAELRVICWRTKTCTKGQPYGLLASGFLSRGDHNGYSFSCNLKTVSEHQRNFGWWRFHFTRVWCLRGGVSAPSNVLRCSTPTVPPIIGYSMEVELIHECNSHIVIHGPLYEVDILELGKSIDTKRLSDNWAA